MWNHSNWMIFLDFNLKISVNIEIWDIWLSVKKCQTKSFYLIVNLKISSQFGHHYLQLFMLSEDQPRQKEAIHLTQVCKARKNVNGFLAALPKTKTVECVERKNLHQPIIFCMLYMKRNHITFMTFKFIMNRCRFQMRHQSFGRKQNPFFSPPRNCQCCRARHPRHKKAAPFPSKMVHFQKVWRLAMRDIKPLTFVGSENHMVQVYGTFPWCFFFAWPFWTHQANPKNS